MPPAPALGVSSLELLLSFTVSRLSPLLFNFIVDPVDGAVGGGGGGGGGGAADKDGVDVGDDNICCGTDGGGGGGGTGADTGCGIEDVECCVAMDM